MSALTEDISYATDIVTLVSKYVSLRKVGKNRSGLCPFHKEKSPSFTVAEDKQIYKCFGCGKGGGAINFLMEIERIDFWDAIKILAKDARIDLTKYEYKRGEQGSSQQEEKREQLKDLNKQAETRFSHQLVGSVGEDYLRNKRTLSQRTIEMFGLGYAPESQEQLLEAMKAKGFTSDELLKASLAKQNQSGEYSFFRKRIIFPIWDHIGNVVGFAGRSLSAEDMPKYINSTETALYDKSKILYGMHIAKTHLKEFGMIIVVEGYMDVIALYDAGLPVGVASCGTALTTYHAKLLKRHSEKVVFSFDTDNAGFEATIRGLKVAYENELYPSILTLPNGYKDIDEFVHSDNDYRTYLLDPNSRQDGFLFLISKLLTQYDSKNPVERKKVQHLCFDVLTALQDYSIMMMYLDQLAFKFGTNQDSLFQQFKVYLKQKPRFEQRQETRNLGHHERNEMEHGDLRNGLLHSNSLHSQGLGKQCNDLIFLFSAFSDPQFLQEFLGSQINTVKMIHDCLKITQEIGHPTTNDGQPTTDNQLRRQYHYGALDEPKRATEITQRIQKKLLPVVEKFVIKSSLEKKQELLQKIGQLKRG